MKISVERRLTIGSFWFNKSLKGLIRYLRLATLFIILDLFSKAFIKVLNFLINKGQLFFHEFIFISYSFGSPLVVHLGFYHHLFTYLGLNLQQIVLIKRSHDILLLFFDKFILFLRRFRP